MWNYSPCCVCVWFYLSVATTTVSNLNTTRICALLTCVHTGVYVENLRVIAMAISHPGSLDTVLHKYSIRVFHAVYRRSSLKSLGARGQLETCLLSFPTSTSLASSPSSSPSRACAAWNQTTATCNRTLS